MARPRKAGGTLESIEDCQEAIRRLKRQVLQREQLEAARDTAVAAVVDKYAPQIAVATETIRDLELRLQNYYMTHLDELERDGKKSVQLTHGVMGRRLSPPALKLLNKAWTWSSVLAKLREKFGGRFIRYRDPEVDKDSLRKADLSAEQLRDCGLRLEQDEVFYVEIDRTPTPEV